MGRLVGAAVAAVETESAEASTAETIAVVRMESFSSSGAVSKKAARKEV
jgi:hypothetical protein